MYIQNKPASALYKMFIGILALVGFWCSLSEFGLSAWRLFSTSILLLAALYYLISALVLALSHRRTAGQPPCPMLEGLIIVSMSFLCVTTIICHLENIPFAGAGGWHASLIYFVLPFLVLSDWIIFAKKGQWHLGYPFYWLAPLVVYAALIILTGISLPADNPLRYPVSFLNLEATSLPEMLEWFAIIAVLVLVYGYVLFLADMATSGQISKHIVLPRVQTIVLEDDQPAAPQAEPVIERIEVKLEPMPRQKRPAGKTTAHKNSSASTKKTANTDGIKKPNKTTPKTKNTKSQSAKNRATATSSSKTAAGPATTNKTTKADTAEPARKPND